MGSFCLFISVLLWVWILSLFCVLDFGSVFLFVDMNWEDGQRSNNTRDCILGVGN